MFVDPSSKGTQYAFNEQWLIEGYSSIKWHVPCELVCVCVCVSVCASEAHSSAPCTPVPPPALPMETGITAHLMGSRLTSWEPAKCTWSR